MTILGFSFDPLTALVAATMFFGWMFFIIFRRFLNGEFDRNGFNEAFKKREIARLRSKYGLEPEPEIDLDALEAELQMEAAVLEYRLADNRRAEMIARAS